MRIEAYKMPRPFIAIIDDDAGIRAALQMLMRTTGYRVAGFASTEAFVASGVAGMRGFDLVGLLRSEGCAVPVIAMSALADDGLEQAAVYHGNRSFLRKPFESGVPASVVEESPRQ